MAISVTFFYIGDTFALDAEEVPRSNDGWEIQKLWRSILSPRIAEREDRGEALPLQSLDERLCVQKGAASDMNRYLNTAPISGKDLSPQYDAVASIAVGRFKDLNGYFDGLALVLETYNHETGSVDFCAYGIKQGPVQGSVYYFPSFIALKLQSVKAYQPLAIRLNISDDQYDVKKSWLVRSHHTHELEQFLRSDRFFAGCWLIDKPLHGYDMEAWIKDGYGEDKKIPLPFCLTDAGFMEKLLKSRLYVAGFERSEFKKPAKKTLDNFLEVLPRTFSTIDQNDSDANLTPLISGLYKTYSWFHKLTGDNK